MDVRVESDGEVVSFKSDYDYDLKELLKMRGCTWSPGVRVWNHPIYGVEELLGLIEEQGHNLIGLDGLEASMAAQRWRPIDPVMEMQTALPDDLFEYQRQGVLFAIQMKGRVLIADEQGLGKTAQSIVAMANLNPDRILIIAPSSTLENWRREVMRWIECEPVVVTTKNVNMARKKSLPIVGDPIIASYETIKAGLPGHFDGLIIDEAHLIKNKATDRHKSVVALADKAKYVIALTGTPMLSRPKELWGIARAVLGRRACPSYTRYTKRYCRGHRTELGYWKADGADDLSGLNRFFLSFSIRRTKAQVLDDLPEKINQLVPLRGQFGKSRTESIIESLLRRHGTVNQVLIKLGIEGRRTLQADAIREYHENADEKAALPEFLQYIEATTSQDDQKSLIFCTHHCLIDAMARICDGNGLPHVTISGKVPSNERQGLVDRFNKADGAMAAILSIETASVGLNMQAASRVIFAGLPWSPGVMAQAESRAHRYGQKKCVNVYSIIATPFDDLLQAVIMTKTSIIGAAIDGHRQGDSGEMSTIRALVQAVHDRMIAPGPGPSPAAATGSGHKVIEAIKAILEPALPAIRNDHVPI